MDVLMHFDVHHNFFSIFLKFADLCPIETTNMARQKNCQLMAAAASLQIAKEIDDDGDQRV